jgi:hypothetical protein
MNWKRALLLAGLCLLLAVWLVPFAFLRFVLPGMAQRSGGTLETVGAAPALPWGMRASQLKVTREGKTLVIDDFRAVLLPSGPRLDARVAEGTVLVRGDDARLSSGFVRFENFALESLAALSSDPMGFRGRCDGVWRFGPKGSFEGTISNGALMMQQPAPLQIKFTQLVVAAARAEQSGDWVVSGIDMQGPPVSGHGEGTLGADGKLAFTIDIRQLEEPIKGFMAMGHLPTEPLPLFFSLRGSTQNPQLFQRVGTAEAPLR